VVNFTEILAREYGAFGITVNALAPTPVETDLIKSVPKDKIKNLTNRLAIKRLGELKDISNVVDFFIDEKSDFITGQTIFLGGV
jgi:3-oxoacyl-[acyl-carrier protein] reductase